MCHLIIIHMHKCIFPTSVLWFSCVLSSLPFSVAFLFPCGCEPWTKKNCYVRRCWAHFLMYTSVFNAVLYSVFFSFEKEIIVFEYMQNTHHIIHICIPCNVQWSNGARATLGKLKVGWAAHRPHRPEAAKGPLCICNVVQSSVGCVWREYIRLVRFLVLYFISSNYRIQNACSCVFRFRNRHLLLRCAIFIYILPHSLTFWAWQKMLCACSHTKAEDSRECYY